MPFIEVSCGHVSRYTGINLVFNPFSVLELPFYILPLVVLALVSVVTLSWWRGKRPTSWRLGLALLASLDLLGLMIFRYDYIIESFKLYWTTGHNADFLYGFYLFSFFVFTGTAFTWREYEQLHDGYVGWRVLRLVAMVGVLLTCIYILLFDEDWNIFTRLVLAIAGEGK
jgi:hypothetical protein